MSLTLRQILEAANEGYPDDEILAQVRFRSDGSVTIGRGDRGDSLARFVATEIVGAYHDIVNTDGEQPADALQEAIERIEKAIEELQGVQQALEDLSIDSELEPDLDLESSSMMDLECPKCHRKFSLREFCGWCYRCTRCCGCSA